MQGHLQDGDQRHCFMVVTGNDVVVKAEKSRAGNVVTGVSLIALGCFGGTVSIVEACDIPRYYKYNPNVRTDVIYLTINVMVIVAGIRLICP